MLFLLPVFVIDAVKLSHRFAGPIFSLKRTIRGVAAGETPRKVKFREGDFWKELADDYNAMLTKLGALEDETSEAVDDAPLVESK
jgi:nitrogen fixation/metabolism regulation signal transduction histidine kinase